MTTHSAAAEQDATDCGAAAQTDRPAEGLPSSAASGASHAVSLEERQKAYLLQQLLEAPGHALSQGEANKKIGAAAKRDLQLQATTANLLREALARSGHITVTKQHRVVRFALTDDGREYLQTLPQDLFPSTRTEADVPAELLSYQQSYLLRLLANATGRRLKSGELAAKLKSTEARENLAFEGAVSRQVIVPLIEDGSIEETRRRGAGDGFYPTPFASYRLTDKGEQRLFTLMQYPTVLVKIAADVFNRFTEAYGRLLALHPTQPGGPAREETRAAAPTEEKKLSPPTPGEASTLFEASASEAAAPDHTPGQPSPANLAEAILTRLHELLRERYTHAGMAPIHELRAWVAERFGAAAASHKTFDEAAHDLRKRKKVRFVTITDLRDGTPDQMAASIPGVNETFFYLEPAHDQSFDF